MMTKNEQLTALQGARAILDKSYIRHRMTDGLGGHCAQGAILRQLGGFSLCQCGAPGCMSPNVNASFLLLHEKLCESGIALHPELKGAARGGGWLNIPTSFDIAPVVFINDYLGKEAILAVFDSAILELESELHATGELKIVDEIVTAKPAKPEITVMKFWPYMDEVTVPLIGVSASGG